MRDRAGRRQSPVCVSVAVRGGTPHCNESNRKRRPVMTVPALLVLLAGAATAQQAGLRGEAGYREVRLYWTGLGGAAGVRWCEQQSWGEEHHCRRSVLPPPHPRQTNFTTEIRGAPDSGHGTARHSCAHNY